MNLSQRIGRLEAATRQTGHGRAIARVWLRSAWDVLTDVERAGEKIAIILPDNGREAVHHGA